MEEIIYFELDNWFAGYNYPDEEPFLTWMEDDSNLQFENDAWCKENKLCVEAGLIDMSVCFCISAPKTWVEKNCPNLLTNKEYSKFISKNGKGRISGWPFREYKEENFGVHHNNWYREMCMKFAKEESTE